MSAQSDFGRESGADEEERERRQAPPPKLSTVHFAGGMRIGGTQYLRGWACCCSGKRCTDIRDRGNWSYLVPLVTCKRCLALVEKWRSATKVPEGGG